LKNGAYYAGNFSALVAILIALDFLGLSVVFTIHQLLYTNIVEMRKRGNVWEKE